MIKGSRKHDHGVVWGCDVDERTGCAHYRSPLDIIAILFKCCGRFYPCIKCHEACADHPAERWETHEFATRAILCGNCGYVLTISEYLSCDYHCPDCQAPFNPGCQLHAEKYFNCAK